MHRFLRNRGMEQLRGGLSWGKDGDVPLLLLNGSRVLCTLAPADFAGCYSVPPGAQGAEAPLVRAMAACWCRWRTDGVSPVSVVQGPGGVRIQCVVLGPLGPEARAYQVTAQEALGTSQPAPLALPLLPPSHPELWTGDCWREALSGAMAARLLPSAPPQGAAPPALHDMELPELLRAVRLMTDELAQRAGAN